MKHKPILQKLNQLFLILTLVCLSFTNTLAETANEPKSLIVNKEKLTLVKTLNLVIKGNTELKAYSWDLRASDAQILQAKLLPNPSFNYQIENIAGSGEFSGTDAAEITYTINQLVELGGKRSARTSFASQVLESRKADYEIKRNEIFGDTIIKFYHVAADQERLKLARSTTKKAEKILKIIKKRVEAGKSSNVEFNKAKLFLAQLSIEEEHAEHELATAKIRLSTNWGNKKFTFNQVESNLFQNKKIPSFNNLISNIDNSPTIKRWLIEKKAKEAKIELEEANQIPDITLGLSYRRFELTGSDAAVMQFTVPLPLFNRNQHKLYQARAISEKVKALHSSSKSKIKELIFSVYKELTHFEVDLKVNKEVILPAASSALKETEEGFKIGRFSYFELADAQKTYFKARQNYINSALKYQESLVELEKLTGLPLRAKNSLINLKEK